MKKKILDLIKGLSSPDWVKVKGCLPQMIEEVENEFSISLPFDYKQLMLYSSGSTLYGSKSSIHMEPMDYIIGHNINEFFMEYIPGMLVFGDDGSQGIYFYDPAGTMGKGNFSIFYAFSNDLDIDSCLYLAPSLTEVFEKILAGDDFAETLFNM